MQNSNVGYETIGFGRVSGSFCFGGQKGEWLFLRFLHLPEQTRHALYLQGSSEFDAPGYVNAASKLSHKRVKKLQE